MAHKFIHLKLLMKRTFLAFVCGLVASGDFIEISLDRRELEGREDSHQRRLREKRLLSGNLDTHSPHRRLAYEYEVDISNAYNYQYFGSLWLGT